MADPTECPKCSSENIYSDGNMWVCPECSFEWSALTSVIAPEREADSGIVKDAYGNILADGDTVSVIKDLKVKGSSTVALLW